MGTNVARSRPPVPTVTLLSGCGGSDLALRQAGLDVTWANELREDACDTYALNFPHTELARGDISLIREFPAAKLLVGCYPCQGYSQAGLRKRDATVNYLYRDFDRALRQIRPRAFVVENVSGMANSLNRSLLHCQLVRFRSAGYRVSVDVLDAKNYGLAQTRRRVFIVGIRTDLEIRYTFPHPTHGPSTGTPYTTQRQALQGLPDWPEGEFCAEKFHWYYLSRNRRADWDMPSPCIVAHWRHVPLHPSSPPLKRAGPDRWEFAERGRARRLSYRECAALQGFPSSYEWGRSSVRQKFRMIGNAVPPPLFRAVLRQLPDIWS